VNESVSKVANSVSVSDITAPTFVLVTDLTAPDSKILKDLENAPEFKKAQLDERMVAELLRDGGQCTDCIWEGRGYMRDSEGFIVPMQASGELNEFEKQLIAIDLDAKPNYNTLKGIIFGLGIQPLDNKVATYVAVLSKIKADIIVKTNPTATQDKCKLIGDV